MKKNVGANQLKTFVRKRQVERYRFAAGLAADSRDSFSRIVAGECFRQQAG
jgi:hypothetical protein